MRSWITILFLLCWTSCLPTRRYVKTNFKVKQSSKTLTGVWSLISIHSCSYRSFGCKRIFVFPGRTYCKTYLKGYIYFSSNIQGRFSQHETTITYCRKHNFSSYEYSSWGFFRVYRRKIIFRHVSKERIGRGIYRSSGTRTCFYKIKGRKILLNCRREVNKRYWLRAYYR